jgi:hypothetical protein
MQKKQDITVLERRDAIHRVCAGGQKARRSFAPYRQLKAESLMSISPGHRPGDAVRSCPPSPERAKAICFQAFSLMRHGSAIVPGAMPRANVCKAFSLTLTALSNAISTGSITLCHSRPLFTSAVLKGRNRFVRISPFQDWALAGVHSAGRCPVVIEPVEIRCGRSGFSSPSVADRWFSPDATELS